MRNPGDSARILYVSAVDISKGNGPGVNEREFVLALSKRLGDHAFCLIPRPALDLPELRSLNLVPIPGAVRGAASFLKMQLGLVRAGTRLLAREKFDLIVFRLSAFPLGQYWLARHAGRPYAIKTLGVGVVEGTKLARGLKGLAARVLHPLNVWLIGRIARGACAVDAPTQSMVDGNRLRLNLDGRRMTVIANAANIDRFRPGDAVVARERLKLGSFDPIIGYTGGHPQRRGGKQMIEIAPRLLEEFPKLGVVIVGGSQDEIDELARLASRLQVREHVVLTGRVPFEQIPDYVNAFDVCFSFDEDDALLSKGLSSQKICQALAAGRPVISDNPDSRFLEDARIGSVADRSNILQVAQVVNSWLVLSDVERSALRDRASAYAREHLSVQSALERRLRFWGERMSEGGPGPSRGI